MIEKQPMSGEGKGDTITKNKKSSAIKGTLAAVGVATGLAGVPAEAQQKEPVTQEQSSEQLSLESLENSTWDGYIDLPRGRTDISLSFATVEGTHIEGEVKRGSRTQSFSGTLNDKNELVVTYQIDGARTAIDIRLTLTLKDGVLNGDARSVTDFGQQEGTAKFTKN